MTHRIHRTALAVAVALAMSALAATGGAQAQSSNREAAQPAEITAQTATGPGRPRWRQRSADRQPPDHRQRRRGDAEPIRPTVRAEGNRSSGTNNSGSTRSGSGSTSGSSSGGRSHGTSGSAGGRRQRRTATGQQAASCQSTRHPRRGGRARFLTVRRYRPISRCSRINRGSSVVIPSTPSAWSRWATSGLLTVQT